MFKSMPRSDASDPRRGNAAGRRRSLRGALKTLRTRAKVPLMRWTSGLATWLLDRRPRVVEDLDARPPRRILLVRCDRIGDLL